jgi:hypothetical protein
MMSIKHVIIPWKTATFRVRFGNICDRFAAVFDICLFYWFFERPFISGRGKKQVPIGFGK